MGVRPWNFSGRQGGKVQLQNVPRHDLHVGVGSHGLREHRQQRLVQLHRHHFACPLGQLRRKGAHAGANLQHTAVLVGAGGRRDVIGDLGIDEEVLSHGLGKVEAVPAQQLPNSIVVAKIHIAAAFLNR